MRVSAGMDVFVIVDSFFLTIATLFLSYMVIVFFRQDYPDVGCGLAKGMMLKMNHAHLLDSVI